jgi:hypothetical protein
MDVNALGLVIIAAVVLMYLQKPVLSPADFDLGRTPNAQNEVDVTRWRHDGTQPYFWTRGNGASFVDEAASRLRSFV